MITLKIIRNYKETEQGLSGKELTEFWIRKSLRVHENVPVLRHTKGKPYIEGQAEFSVSHSGDLLAIAFGDTALGLDLQESRQLDYMKISRRYFTSAEQETIQSADDFFRLWTRKEAYAKYTGEGLSQIMSRTDVTCCQDVRFYDCMIGGYFCCICMGKDTDDEIHISY